MDFAGASAPIAPIQATDRSIPYAISSSEADVLAQTPSYVESSFEKPLPLDVHANSKHSLPASSYHVKTQSQDYDTLGQGTVVAAPNTAADSLGDAHLF